ncbi:MAG TPA: hypothetical protein PK031_07575 [Pseudomonadales bacterium]|nr:hypothetical protein [Pseudomonadales bacterium]
MIEWTEPLELINYSCAKRQPGIYIIGGVIDQSLPMVGCGEEDPYLFKNWPDNLIPYYIGISETKNVGVRGRLSAHSRCKGNKGIAKRVIENEHLYFIAAYGNNCSQYEAVVLCLKNACQFEDNVRCEIDRDAKRRYRKVRAEMTQSERDHYDNLDYDGRGL